MDLLKDKKDKLEIIAKELLEKEIIFQSDLDRLIGKRPFDRQTTYEEFTNGTLEAKRKEKKASDDKKTKAKAKKLKAEEEKERLLEKPEKDEKTIVSADPKVVK